MKKVTFEQFTRGYVIAGPEGWECIYDETYKTWQVAREGKKHLNAEKAVFNYVRDNLWGDASEDNKKEMVRKATAAFYKDYREGYTLAECKENLKNGKYDEEAHVNPYEGYDCWDRYDFGSWTRG